MAASTSVVELWVALTARLDDGSWATAEPVLLAGGGLTLGLEWRRAVAPGIDNGDMYLMADGVPVAWLTELDTDQQTIREIVAVGNLDIGRPGGGGRHLKNDNQHNRGPQEPD